MGGGCVPIPTREETIVARPKGGAPSLSSVFKKYYEDHPEWARASSNDAVLKQYLADHPNAEITKSVRQIVANVKSWLKRQGRKGKRGRRGRPPKAAATVVAVTATPSRPGPRTAAMLEALEEHIDECMARAVQADRAALEDVIRHLRRARGALALRLYG